LKWRTPDIIAIIFALTISILLLSAVYGSIVKGIIVSDVKSNLISAVVGSMITLIAHVITKKKEK